MASIAEEYEELVEKTRTAFAEADMEVLEMLSSDHLSPIFGMDYWIRVEKPRAGPNTSGHFDKYPYNPPKGYGFFRPYQQLGNHYGDGTDYGFHLRLPSQMYGDSPDTGSYPVPRMGQDIPVTCQACGLSDTIISMISHSDILQYPVRRGEEYHYNPYIFIDYDGDEVVVKFFAFFPLIFKPLACTLGASHLSWGRIFLWPMVYISATTYQQ